jgi:hypothetical protein
MQNGIKGDKKEEVGREMERGIGNTHLYVGEISSKKRGNQQT